MSSVYFVRSHNALPLTIDRIISDMDAELVGMLDDVWNRDADDFADDGIFLPDPTSYIRRQMPDAETGQSPGRVNVYVGQMGSTEFSPYSSGDGDGDSKAWVDGGYLEWAAIPIRLMVSALLAPGWSADDPVTGEPLDRTERVNRRVQYYIGTIKAGLTQWSTGDPIDEYGDDRDYAFRDVEIDADFSTAVQFEEITDETDGIRGHGMIDFTAHHVQHHPA